MDEQEVSLESETPRERRRFFDKWAEKFKEFLDNAE
jgi:cell division protein FtsA